MRSDLLAQDRRTRHRNRALAATALAVATVAAWAAPRGLLLRETAYQPHAAVAVPPVVAAGDIMPANVHATAPVGTAALKTRPLSAWLADVARDAGRDLVLSPELRGDLTASESSRLDWKQRLEAYSRVFGFDFTVEDALIEVRRGDADTRTARPAVDARRDDAKRGEIDSATARVSSPAVPTETDAAPARDGSAPHSGSRHAGDAPPGPPPQTRVVRLAYESAKDAAGVLSKAGDALDVTVTADASSNALVLSGQPASIGRVLGVVGDLDRPRRRILLEAKMIEVSHSARLDFGVEWKLTGTTVGGDVKFPPPAGDAGSAALVIATHGAAALDARISALEASGKLHVVSRPSVVMIEGSPATIESVRILRIRLPSSGTVVGDEVVSGPSSGRATEDIPVGVRLEVTPAIRGGGQVLLRIRAKSSSLGAPLPPDNIPEELSRMVDAEVLVSDGETAVLGGLSREAGSRSGAGVPVLRDVPALGRLFGKKSDVRDDEELMVLVTPRVLD